MATLLEIATNMYDSNSYDWGGPSEGPGPYDGTADIDGNEKLDIDCSHLVHNVLAAAGYNIPYLSTSQLHSSVAQLYFDIVTLQEANCGDLILYPKHVGIFARWDPAKGTGEYFGSQSKGPAFAKFDNHGTWGWKMNFIILRPKRSFYTGKESPMHADVAGERWSRCRKDAPASPPAEGSSNVNNVRWRREATAIDGGFIYRENGTRWLR